MSEKKCPNNCENAWADLDAEGNICYRCDDCGISFHKEDALARLEKFTSEAILKQAREINAHVRNGKKPAYMYAPDGVSGIRIFQAHIRAGSLEVRTVNGWIAVWNNSIELKEY